MRGTHACLLLVLGPLVSCGGGAAEVGQPTLYTATATDADGDGASMALLADDSALTVYVCSDDPERDGYAGWFRGSLAAAGPSVVEHDGWRLVAERASGGVDVAVTSPDGDTLRFAATRARPDGLTGLYAADADGCTTGVIVIGRDGDAVVRGASCDGTGRVLQVTPARPLALVEGELAVEVEASASPRRVFLAPVRSVRP